MAQENLRPNSNGTYQQVYNQKPTSGQHYDKVDEVTPDYGTTAIYSKNLTPPPPPIPQQQP
jgi:hypothetical protein